MGFGKDGKGVIIREKPVITVGGLASIAVIKQAGGITLQSSDFRIIKTEYMIVQRGAFGAEGDSVLIGLADNELSVTEIAEAINVDGPVDKNDHVKMEQASRPVWLLAHIKEPHQSTTSYANIRDLAPSEKVFRWTFTATEAWTWFAYNPLGGALTTGAVFVIFAKHYGVWVD